MAYPQRIEKQVEFLTDNTDYGIVGTHYELIDAEDNKIRKVSIPTSNEALHYRLLFSYPLCHPSVMYRADILKNYALNYDKNLRRAVDHKLLVQLIEYTKMVTLSDGLIQYRKHSDSITASKKTLNGQVKADIMRDYHERSLSDSFVESASFKTILTTYYLEEWQKVEENPMAFAKAMNATAEQYVMHNTADKKLIFYGYCKSTMACINI